MKSKATLENSTKRLHWRNHARNVSGMIYVLGLMNTIRNRYKVSMKMSGRIAKSHLDTEQTLDLWLLSV